MVFELALLFSLQLQWIDLCPVFIKSRMRSDNETRSTEAMQDDHKGPKNRSDEGGACLSICLSTNPQISRTPIQMGGTRKSFGRLLENSLQQKAPRGANGNDAMTEDGKKVQVKANYAAAQIGFRGCRPSSMPQDRIDGRLE